MSGHQERVSTEYNELVDKLNKLNNFLPSSTFHALPAEEQDRLVEQAVYMTQYAGVLRRRIRAL